MRETGDYQAGFYYGVLDYKSNRGMSVVYRVREYRPTDGLAFRAGYTDGWHEAIEEARSVHRAAVLRRATSNGLFTAPAIPAQRHVAEPASATG